MTGSISYMSDEGYLSNNNVPIVVGMGSSPSTDNVISVLGEIKFQYPNSLIYLLVPDAVTKALFDHKFNMDSKINYLAVDSLLDVDDVEIKRKLVSAYILRHAHVLLTTDDQQTGILQERILRSEDGHRYTGISVEDSLIPEVPVLQEQVSLICWNLTSNPQPSLDPEKNDAWKDRLMVLGEIDNFNRQTSVKANLEEWKTQRKWFLFAQNRIKTNNPDKAEVERPDLVQKEQEAVDLLADTYASATLLANDYQENSFRNFTILSIVAGIAMICFIIVDRVGDLSSQHYFYLNLAFWSCTGIAFVLAKSFANKKEQKLHLQYRALAESVRVQSAWLLLGLQSPVIDYYPAKQRKELGWVIEAMRGLHVLLPFHLQQDILSKQRVDFVRHAWLLDQKNYLRNKLYGNQKDEEGYKPKFTNYEKKLHRCDLFLIKWPRWIAVGLATYLSWTKIKSTDFPVVLQEILKWIARETSHLWFPPHWAIFLVMIVCLAISLSVSRYISAMEFALESDWYISSKTFYERANDQIKNYFDDEAGVREMAAAIFLRLGKAILHEQSEWVSIHKRRELFESVETKD